MKIIRKSKKNIQYNIINLFFEERIKIKYNFHKPVSNKNYLLIKKFTNLRLHYFISKYEHQIKF